MALAGRIGSITNADGSEVIFPRTKTKAITDETGKNLDEILGEGFKIKLLWENAALKSAFPAQKIAVNLAGYSAVMIEAQLDNAAPNFSQTALFWFPVGTTTNEVDKFAHISWCDTMYMNGRAVKEISNSGITFGRGTNGRVAQPIVYSDAAAVPLKIYGVKF